ncbi:MAG TPA: phosphopantothenoylcysteine decarboxylase [Lentisphaeria bacterium]|nr:MAG: phosphopantothenoylcysteine decarboxylase [Lentisphaerae bacterium GWF2_50_93]HCE47067.1 phosphopantothenoylcysteine decarboxylase [Lentisphaeria bacterium]
MKSTVVIGVTGSIAAYKAADLTSQLVKKGKDVVVIMTASAQKLVGPQTFLTLSRNPVITDLWAMPDWQPGHIELADRAKLLAVVPCTANFIGKLANGIADDALSTYALSHTGKVVVVPAMNPKMWKHPAVQKNVKILKSRGVEFIGPVAGRVACGDNGEGRMEEVPAILARILEELK